MSGIFISYRRKDTIAEARAIFERLRREMPAEEVFIDLEGIDIGVDFTQVIDTQLKRCQVALVLIGSDWLGQRNARGRYRLEDENDFVRIELRALLSRDIRIVPVLIGNALLPESEDLPEDVRPLLRRNKFDLAMDTFDSDMRDLVSRLKKMLAATATAAPGAATTPAAPVTAPPTATPPTTAVPAITTSPPATPASLASTPTPTARHVQPSAAAQRPTASQPPVAEPPAVAATPAPSARASAPTASAAPVTRPTPPVAAPQTAQPSVATPPAAPDRAAPPTTTSNEAPRPTPTHAAPPVRPPAAAEPAPSPAANLSAMAAEDPPAARLPSAADASPRSVDAPVIRLDGRERLPQRPSAEASRPSPLASPPTVTALPNAGAQPAARLAADQAELEAAIAEVKANAKAKRAEASKAPALKEGAGPMAPAAEPKRPPPESLSPAADPAPASAAISAAKPPSKLSPVTLGVVGLAVAGAVLVLMQSKPSDPGRAASPAAEAPRAEAHPAQTPAIQPFTRFRDCDSDACPWMIALPAGSFMMGSPTSEPQRETDEGPQHRVQVPAFAVGQYEVTFAQWDACVAAGGCSHRPDDRGWGRGDRPVINVSWNDAQAYVKWLSGKTGKTYRLPSEAEWEYAARAGTDTPFAFGERISTAQANFDGRYTYNGSAKGEYRQKTLPVGSLQANAWQLYDVHGNVWEWVQDCWHGDYANAPSDGSEWRTNCSSDGRRVLRGGGWDIDPRGARSAIRNNGAPEIRYDGIGFRLARTLLGP